MFINAIKSVKITCFSITVECRTHLYRFSVAHNFIFSQEYINKNKSNEAFVDDLYQMFFGRGRGSGEGQSWINELNAGVKDREQVFNGFVNSPEFNNLCSSYGINP